MTTTKVKPKVKLFRTEEPARLYSEDMKKEIPGIGSRAWYLFPGIYYELTAKGPRSWKLKVIHIPESGNSASCVPMRKDGVPEWLKEILPKHYRISW